MMLECRAFHHYIQRDMHPEYYRLMDNGRLPKGFYAPELLSSSYIARTFQQHYNELRQDAGLPQINYKMASVNPRNPVNLATDYEKELIEWFNEDKSRTHYREIVEENGKKYLLYATPFLEVKQRCLKCHGKPENAPEQLQKIYNWKGGFNYKLGDIVAAEFIRSPMEGEYSAAFAYTTGFIVVLVVGIVLLVFNNRLRLIVTRRTKALTSALKRAEESDRLKSAFLANMSHEIRTPMNGIMGFADLLKEQNLTGDEQKRYISIIEKSGNRMLNIINDLINISRIESGQLEANYSIVNINELNEELFSFFEPESKNAGLSLSFQNGISDKEANIITDKEKLSAILSNLIKNAIKYTRNGWVKFGYKRYSGQIEYFVKDSGIGIPEGKQEAVFDRFVQADLSISSPYEGAGLGLAITKGYVDLLGGRIWLDSEHGKGTTFYFTIPYKSKTSQEIQTEHPDKTNPKTEKNIKGESALIVDDVESADIYLSRVLKSSFKTLLHAKTGRKAVEICKGNKNIDLILMDIKIPDMDGYQATKEITAFNEDVIIIAQTAYAMEGDREKAMEAGCDDYIAKPIKKNELLELISKYI